MTLLMEEVTGMLMRADVLADALDKNINNKKKKQLFIYLQKEKNLIKIS